MSLLFKLFNTLLSPTANITKKEKRENLQQARERQKRKKKKKTKRRRRSLAATCLLLIQFVSFCVLGFHLYSQFLWLRFLLLGLLSFSFLFE